MNAKMYTMVLLMSALPLVSAAKSQSIFLNEGDFIAAEKVDAQGDKLLRLKLSKSGKAKLKKLQTSPTNIHTELAGVSKDFKLRERPKGDGVEIGPYSAQEADQIVKKFERN